MDLDNMPKPVFLTLTFPADFPAEDEARLHLRNLWKRLVRSAGGTSAALWRLELQDRGAPHFHLIMWLPKKLHHSWYAQNWFEVVGSGDEKHLRAGTRVEHIRTRNGLVWYVSKYVAKTAQDATTGRVWGLLGRRYIKYHDKIEMVLTPDQFETLKNEYETRVQGLGDVVRGFSLYNADLFDLFLDATPDP